MKNKKILGKINVIDFIIILVIIVAAAVIAVSKLSDGVSDDKQTLEITYFAEEVHSSLTEKVKNGDELFDDTSKTKLGKATKAPVIGDSVSYALDEHGVYHTNAKPDYNSIYVTGEVQGIKTDFGAKVEKQNYGVGHTFVLVSGNTKFTVRVYDIKVKD